MAFCSVKEDCHRSQRQHSTQLEDSVLRSLAFFCPDNDQKTERLGSNSIFRQKFQKQMG